MKRISLHFPVILGVMAVMLATAASAQTGSLFKITLKASKLKAVTVVAPSSASQLYGTSQCPGIGPAAFATNVGEYMNAGNDTTQYFDGVHTAPVLEISHLRVTFYVSDQALPADLAI